MSYKNLLSKKRKFIELLKTSGSYKPEPSEIIKTLGISKATYYRWRRDKEILKYLKDIFAKFEKSNPGKFLKPYLDKFKQSKSKASMVLSAIFVILIIYGLFVFAGT